MSLRLIYIAGATLSSTGFNCPGANVREPICYLHKIQREPICREPICWSKYAGSQFVGSQSSGHHPPKGEDRVSNKVRADIFGNRS